MSIIESHQADIEINKKELINFLNVIKSINCGSVTMTKLLDQMPDEGILLLDEYDFIRMLSTSLFPIKTLHSGRERPCGPDRPHTQYSIRH